MKLALAAFALALVGCHHANPQPLPAAPAAEPDAATEAPVGDAAPPCQQAETNLVRLGCRPEAFPPPGADRFAVVCERVLRAHLTKLDPACIARAGSIGEVRACGRAVRCADTR